VYLTRVNFNLSNVALAHFISRIKLELILLVKIYPITTWS